MAEGSRRWKEMAEGGADPEVEEEEKEEKEEKERAPGEEKKPGEGLRIGNCCIVGDRIGWSYIFVFIST